MDRYETVVAHSFDKMFISLVLLLFIPETKKSANPLFPTYTHFRETIETYIYFFI